MPNTFQKWRTALVKKGYVEKVKGKLHGYRPTEKGRALVNGNEARAA